MVQAEARTTMAPSLPYSESALVSLPCVSLFGWDSRYLLAVQTAGIGLDRDELLTTDGEAIGKGVVGGGEGRGEGVDILLRELDVREDRLAGTECHPASPRRSSTRTVKPGDWASRPEKSAARIPALSNLPEPIRLEVESQYRMIGGMSSAGGNRTSSRRRLPENEVSGGGCWQRGSERDRDIPCQVAECWPMVNL